ncbi:aminodeoxychorismate lyase, partial [Vibrio toranzoniae]|uniref:aminodeoxychorismate lyase n=1 Tax=Vibrio toranzoniae TaxID=1194427 RepID=UPI00137724D8
MFLINGVVQDQLSATDRGLQFGDGCFTTARVVNGQICWLPMDIQRLQQGAERLLLPTIDWSLLQQEMTELAHQSAQGVVKVILTRGSGGRGYSGVGCEHPTRILSLSDYPAHYSLWCEQGITLALSPIPLAQNPLLAGIKHLNRLE